MKKKLKLLFFIAIFLWICYIVLKIVNLLLNDRILTKKIEKYERKLRENTKDTPITLFALASMYHDRLHDYEKALASYQKILGEFPECDFAELVQYMIGECYEKMGRIELATYEYKKYLESYPSGKQSAALREKLDSLEKKGK